MSKPKELRLALQAYMADNMKINARRSSDFVKANKDRVKRGYLPLTTLPKYVDLSFQDLLLWTQQQGHYAPSEEGGDA